MIAEQLLRRRRPGLLVSVRSADEALAALAGGADVIDVKEPDRGPLGAADWQTIDEVVRVVDGRAPVTAAAGELVELLPAIASHSLRPMPAGVALVKIGLAQCAARPDWTTLWRSAMAALGGSGPLSHCRPVAVCYADWRSAGSPPPDEICTAAVDIACPVVLVDTSDKSGGDLFAHWPVADLGLFVQRMHARAFAVVLAGSLARENLLAAAELGPQLVAVRAAACDSGRRGHVSRIRVEELRHALEAAPYIAASRQLSAATKPSGTRHRHQEFP